MQRKLTAKLHQWNKNPQKKPLMVIGARQVGKTYTVDEFCRQNFAEYYYFNLFDRADIAALFKEDINTKDKVKRLELIIGESVDFERAVFFFDEIQESEELISALKFFAESPTPYNVVCAGSLLGVKLRRFTKSFPVGKVELLSMYPMDMEEYLWAFGEEGLVHEIRDCHQSGRAMVKPLHDKALGLFRTYLCTGGMPEAVQQIASVEGDVLRFQEAILENIVISYLSDMNKYILTSMEASRIEAIYGSIPSQLNNKSGKFQFAKVAKSARSRNYESALNWLTSSGMIRISNAVEIPKMPLKGYEKDGYFKLYLNDPGILRHQLNIRPADIMLDVAFELKGILTENYIANQLTALDIPLCYWRNADQAEIDFLLDLPGGIVPIEVKSGQNKKSSSLKTYIETYKPPYAIRLLQRNFGSANGIITIPLYAAFCLP
ncbi:MAG: AAA family ATPase [Coriobacteriia bacterium]|nr:AAA family ATPase [Coriobacteriia bacterium]